MKKPLDFRVIDQSHPKAWRSRDYLICGYFTDDGTPQFSVRLFSIASSIIGLYGTLREAKEACATHEQGKPLQRTIDEITASFER